LKKFKGLNDSTGNLRPSSIHGIWSLVKARSESQKSSTSMPQSLPSSSLVDNISAQTDRKPIKGADPSINSGASYGCSKTNRSSVSGIVAATYTHHGIKQLPQFALNIVFSCISDTTVCPGFTLATHRTTKNPCNASAHNQLGDYRSAANPNSRPAAVEVLRVHSQLEQLPEP
jgi:hypothetical protein